MLVLFSKRISEKQWPWKCFNHGMVEKDTCFNHGMVGKEGKEFGHEMIGRKKQIVDPILVISKTFQKGFQKGFTKVSTNICRCYIYKRNYLIKEPLLEPSYYHNHIAYPLVLITLLRWFASTFKVFTSIVPSY